MDLARVTALAASVRARRYLFSGAMAGILSAISFAFIHALFISNIWFSVVPMIVAGALCGLGISWSYRVVVKRPSLGYPSKPSPSPPPRRPFSAASTWRPSSFVRAAMSRIWPASLTL